MDQAELKSLLDELITRWENEEVEFEQASNDFSTDDIGRYFSALANEANLRGTESGWLVFGVNNKTRAVVGTDYREQPERLQSLKMQIAQNAEVSSRMWVRTPLRVGSSQPRIRGCREKSEVCREANSEAIENQHVEPLRKPSAAERLQREAGAA